MPMKNWRLNIGEKFCTIALHLLSYIELPTVGVWRFFWTQCICTVFHRWLLRRFGENINALYVCVIRIYRWQVCVVQVKNRWTGSSSSSGHRNMEAVGRLGQTPDCLGYRWCTIRRRAAHLRPMRSRPDRRTLGYGSIVRPIRSRATNRVETWRTALHVTSRNWTIPTTFTISPMWRWFLPPDEAIAQKSVPF